LHAWSATASGSTIEASLTPTVGGRRTTHDSGTTISSAMPPSVNTPSMVAVASRQSWGRPFRHCAHVPHRTNGCTATSVPSSSTPAIS